MNKVTVFCPKCYAAHEIDNAPQNFKCQKCEREIDYHAFTCPLYVTCDNHGMNVSNLGRPSENIHIPDIRRLGDYAFELVKAGEPRAWDENHLKITNNNKLWRLLDEFFISSFCIDEQYVYYNAFNVKGYKREHLGVFALAYGNFDPKPVRLCDSLRARHMIAYEDFFVFSGAEQEELRNMLLIMPKNGSWIRRLCNENHLNVYGNWAYYTEKPGDFFALRRVSLDGKTDVPMGTIYYLSTLNVSREGVFFNATDNLFPLHRLDLFENANLKDGEIYCEWPEYLKSILPVSFTEDNTRGVFYDPLIVTETHAICQGMTKISLATGAVSKYHEHDDIFSGA